MPISAEFYVIHLGRKADPRNVPMIEQHDAQVAQEADPPEFAQPQLNARPNRRGVLEPVLKRHGDYPIEDRDEKRTARFSDFEMAAQFARNLATKYPQMMFGVFSCKEVYETTVPDVLVKEFTSSGELVLKKEN